MSENFLQIPDDWRDAAEEIKLRGGTVMIMGNEGSGKTTFGLYLAGAFCKLNRKVIWIDADPGQPCMGPPAILSLSQIADPADLIKRKAPQIMSFVGNTSPVGRLLEMISGLQKLSVIAASLNPDLIVINSCGLVDGGAARELGFHEIDMLSPNFIVALQKANEVEHLLAPHSKRAGLLIQRLPVSPDAKVSTREARRAEREMRFKTYFRGAEFSEIAMHDVGIHGPGLGTGERLGFRDINKLSKVLRGIVVHAELSVDRLFLLLEGDYAEEELFTAKEQYNVRDIIAFKSSELDHLLVGLNDERNLCLGLGILRQFDPKDLILKIITPLKETFQVRHITLGSLRVSPAGNELGQL